ncbi:MAG: uncharacterized protein KVP18_001365 [Porospora cf. gigantea A]|uniref:uncharacterized protein n=2 Tax=Porospora cf. gigantea A TaxID=2853593 RepID=UPI00355A5161|nr:MAG: hypothetical protein KVP18_001365 [Porospora cf. gigantea A]
MHATASRWCSARVQVETAWLLKLSQLGFFQVSGEDIAELLVCSEEEAERVKAYEAVTNHDVKAVEYWMRDRLKNHPQCLPWIHFGLTSEDINNTAYAIMVKSASAVLEEALMDVMSSIAALAQKSAASTMLGRTHGQPATPTTFGKEVAVFLWRLMDALEPLTFKAKFNGATGNYNALVLACPEVDWVAESQAFIESLGLTFQLISTQIECHDWLARLANRYALVNTILLDMCRDLWQYVSLGYLKLRIVESEVGSSTMPHKVNPIHFENAEGNLGLSNALLNHLASKLPVSRLQRDLSDSTVLRSLGEGLGHSLIAYKSIVTGLSRVAVDNEALNEDLQDHNVLGEAVQTVLRRNGDDQAYEKLKALTRSHGSLSHEQWSSVMRELGVTELSSLTPGSYAGVSEDLALRVCAQKLQILAGMAIISAAIVSSRTCAVSRQFVSITRLRMEGLITAFQRLVENSESETKDHTFIETDSVRYVYSPLDQLYLVIITSLDSNILEDLDTIRLLQSAVQDVCPDHVDESAVLSKAFDIIFAFDEVVSFGQREAVTLAQIRQYVEMDSVEEKLQKIVRNMKEREEKARMKKKALELASQRAEAAGRKTAESLLKDFSLSSVLSTRLQSSLPPQDFTPQPLAATEAHARVVNGPRKGLQLGTKRDVTVQLSKQ